LGGSFNPAHEGHLHVSLLALKKLGLHELWWLVSPQNPLKPVGGLAPLEKRLKAARAVPRHPAIRVCDLERRLGTFYTVDTLRALSTCFPATRFVWIMGADNLAQIPLWKDWTGIFEAVPIAIFDRPSYSLGALAGQAAHRYRRYRLPPRRAKELAGRLSPAWIFFHDRLNPASATQIRAAARRGQPREGTGRSDRRGKRQPGQT
jgi:nicotinate-nucleotide adenylyltransferase